MVVSPSLADAFARAARRERRELAVCCGARHVLSSRLFRNARATRGAHDALAARMIYTLMRSLRLVNESMGEIDGRRPLER